MAVKALYLKWRPMTFEEVVGQEHVTTTLRHALASNRVGHAYLFSGPRGTGKTTMARLLAKAVNCLDDDPLNRPCNQCAHCTAVNQGRFLDMIEIDAASHTSVDDVRELRDRIAFAPNEGRYKVYIIDEVHRFSGAAFDALLKTIEEPPEHAIFVLATTEIHKVPQTILSRCQRFDFRRIALPEVVNRLWEMVEGEGLQAEEAALELVARQGTGSLRDSISLLDQLMAEPGEVLTLALAQAVLGATTDDSIRDLTYALIGGDTAAGLDIVNYALDQGADARQFARQMVDHLRRVMLVQTAGPSLVESQVSAEELEVIAQQAGQLPRRALIDALQAFNEAANDLRGGWQPQLPLELAFLESVEALVEPQPAAVPQSQPQPQAQAQAARPAPPDVQPVVEPEQPPVEESSAPAAPAPDAPTMGALQNQWKNLLETIKRNRHYEAEALLGSGSLYGVDGYNVIAQMPSDILVKKLETDHNRQVIESALQEIFRLPLKIQYRVGVGTQQPESDRLDVLLAEDDVVAFAVKDLGGTVTQIDESEE
jgi:DNA polymerase-3 subunit gamma/tau